MKRLRYVMVGILAVGVGVFTAVVMPAPSNKPAPSAPPSVEPEATVKEEIGANPPPTLSQDPMFGSCAEAIRAGYGPYNSNDPEFEWYRDGDGDGVVCERP